jgi:uncharacterized protein YycO
VFRIGTAWQSALVRRAEKKTAAPDPYSHVGMLIGEPGHWQVLHSVPAELPGRPDGVVRDDLDFFLAPERASGVAFYRARTDAATRMRAVNNALARLGTPFHIVADDREGQYCTTLIWHAFRLAGFDLAAHFDQLNVPMSAGAYLLPHGLREAKHLEPLYEWPRP